MTKKIEHYKELFQLLLKEPPPDKMIEDYVTSPYTAPDNMLELADWCGTQARLSWMTGISIIDAVTDIYNDAAARGLWQ